MNPGQAAFSDIIRAIPLHKDRADVMEILDTYITTVLDRVNKVAV